MLTPATRGEYGTLLDALALDSAAGNAPALVYLATDAEPVVVSRSDLIRRVRGYRHALDTLGVQAREQVIVALEDTLGTVYAFWGALLLGAVPAVYPGPSPARARRTAAEDYPITMRALVERLGARAVLVGDAVASGLSEHLACGVYGSGRLEALQHDTPAAEQPAYAASPSDTAYVQTSSGTTGAQKAVPTTHAMLLSQMASYTERLEITAEDVVVNWMPLYHDGGLILGAILPIVQAVTAVLISPQDWVQHPAILFKAIHAYRGTLCTMPNFAFNHSVRGCRERDVEGLSLGSMRAFINGSERVYHTSFEAFLARFGGLGVTRDRFAVAYGLAENTLMAAHTRIGEPPRLDRVDREALELEGRARPTVSPAGDALITVSCGPPLAGATITIVDEGHAPLPERFVGEVALQSDCLFSGYHGDAGGGRSQFAEGRFLTGDMGYMAAGELYIVGRKKDLIINGGKNIYPADLEEIAGTIDGVRPGRVVAFGIPDEREGTELIAIVAEVTTDDPVEQAAIAAAVRRVIVQRAFVTASYVDLINDRWLTKTSSGKMARAANRRRWLAERRAGALAG